MRTIRAGIFGALLLAACTLAAAQDAASFKLSSFERQGREGTLINSVVQ
jgi:hypothetical protein